MKDIFEELDGVFKEAENRVKAVQMTAYMKDHFAYYGIAAPERKMIFRELWIAHKDTLLQNWKEYVKLSWAAEQREHQYLGMGLVTKVYKKLEFEDLDFFLKLIRTKSWWDTVDFLAAGPVGVILSKDRNLASKLAREWITVDDMWIQRTALIHQLKYKKEVDLDLLFYLITQIKGSKEFFINKAAGWALRSASKCYPFEIKEFLYDHPDLSNLTKREASKYI